MHAVTRFHPCLLAGALLLSAYLGCGNSEADRYHLSGTVTHEGQPVAFGSIVFQPDQSQGNSGAYATASIKDGKFNTRSGGKGTVGGPHLVMIEAFDGQDINDDFAPYGKSLGESYQRRFDLPSEASTLDIELTDR